MAQGSVSCGPVLVPYPEPHWWYHPLFSHPQRTNAMDGTPACFSNWEKCRTPRTHIRTHSPRIDQNPPGWTASSAEGQGQGQVDVDDVTKGRLSRKSSGQSSPDDYRMTSAMTKSRQFPWQPRKQETPSDDDVRMISSVKTNPGTALYEQKEDHSPDDVSMTSALASIRERSRSAGSWGPIGMNHLSGGHGVVRGGFYSNGPYNSDEGRRSELLFEARRRDVLLNLWASRAVVRNPGQWNVGIKEEEGIESGMENSPSLSLASDEGISFRRNSTAEQQRQKFKTRQQEVRERYGDLPIDMTCRIRKSKLVNPTNSGRVMSTASDSGRTPVERSGEPSDQSILRSMLTERGRSYSMSALEARGCRLLNTASGSATNQNALPLRQVSISTERQRVTLAKKNLLPVTARTSDLLGRTMDFATSIPEFARLFQTDQEALLSSSCMRLLLLSMAEINLQFATTVVVGDSTTCRAGAGQVDHLLTEEVTSKSIEQSKEPTIQFANSIQNFIRKFQTLNVTSEEYFYMKLITLFHSGIGSIDCTRTANRMNAAARKDLQDVVSRSHPNERLRYPTLLLSLHTLFGIHCGMLQSLFCQHLDRAGGIRGFVCDAISTKRTAGN